MNKLAIKLFLSLLPVIGFLPIASSQTVKSPSQPQSTQPSPVSQDDVIRVSTELVQTDVTVFDKQGRFFEGLNRDQFELKINGKEQPITFFERVTAGSSKELALLSSRREGQPSATIKETPASPAESSALERGRTAFLFVDDHHLSMNSMVRTRELLRNHVDNLMGAKDQAVIATASGQLGFLQQLTGDREVLRSAIERLTYRPFSSGDTITSPPMNEYQAVAIENGDREAFSYFVDKQCEEFKRMGRGGCPASTGITNNAIYDDAVARNRSTGTTSGTSPGPIPVGSDQTSRGPSSAIGNSLRAEAERVVRSRARIIARQAAQVTLNTLSSLEGLIRTSAPIRERKLVVFISDGFFLNYLRSTNAYDLRRIADVALRSGTVIYTIDARGLVTGSIDASAKDGFDPQGRSVRLAMSEVTAAQDPLHALANDTGGRALLNTNDLQKGLAQALQETASYYLLAWRPEGIEVAKDRFRHIEVKIKERPDLTVRVRSGFFSDDPNGSKPGSSGVASRMSVDDQLMEAIRATYPKAGIPVILSLGYLDRAPDDLTLAASVQIERQPGNVSEGQQTQDAELDVIGAVIDDTGNIMTSLKQKVSIPADQTAKANTMVLTLQFPKITPGLRQVRIAARDSRTGRLGSTSQWIEIPNLKQSGLSLSSIFLSETSFQKPTIKPDALFSKSGKLRFQTYVYNAGSSASPPNIAMQVELRRNGQMVTQTPPSAVPMEGVKDLARIPIVGEFPLQNFPEGQYELKIVVTDQANKKSVSRSITFVIE
jgi:VWFA-related protein